MKSFKVAYVGAGFMNREHARAFDAVSEFTNVGIYSRTKSKAVDLAANYAKTQVFDSIQELYQNTFADVVVVSVPELQAREVCEQAFRFPWKILLEKPAGYDLNDANLINNLALKNKCDVYVALNRRHYNSTRVLMQELAKTEGRRFIQILDQEDQLSARQAGQPELVVQNWMYANSIHLIDYFTFLGRGEIINVEPVVHWSATKPFHVVSKITYSSGDIGLYEAAWNRPGPWSATVTVPEARYELRPMEQISVQVYGSRKLEALPNHEWDSQFKAGLRAQAEEMLKVLKGESHQLPSLKDSLRSMELVARIYS